MYKAQITPHWYHNNTRFWYRNDLAGGKREFIRIDAETGTREPAFDHEKAAASLSKAAGKDYAADQMPISEIEFVDDSAAIRFKIGTDAWRCDLKSYECTKVEASNAQKEAAAAEQTARENDPFESESAWITERAADESSQSPQVQDNPQDDRRGRRGGRQRGDDRQVRSPDEKWIAFVRDHNIFIRPAAAGGDNEEDATSDKQLTTDGQEGNAYGMLNWSPDSAALVAFRIEPGDDKQIHLIQSSPNGGGRATLQSRPYPLPGDKFAAHELSVFDVASGKQTKPEVERIDYGRPSLHWRRDGRRFTYEKIDRGHQRFRVIEVDAHTGATRNLIDEKSDTFIWTAHREAMGFRTVTWVGNGNEIIYASERDCSWHLYLVDANEGKIKNAITQGDYVVRGVEWIDDENRQVWFRASGRNPDQDPYLVHYYRVNFDGTGLVALTEGNGFHTVQYSSDRKYLIDTFSRVDQPPVHELRRTSDGALVSKLEEADISELKATGWAPPEVFVAKGRRRKDRHLGRHHAAEVV